MRLNNDVPLGQVFGTESRASGDSRDGAIVSHDQGNVRGAWVYTPCRQASLDLIEKRLEHRSYAAPDDNNIRIEKIHNVSQPDSEEFSRFQQKFAR